MYIKLRQKDLRLGLAVECLMLIVIYIVIIRMLNNNKINI